MRAAHRAWAAGGYRNVLESSRCGKLSAAAATTAATAATAATGSAASAAASAAAASLGNSLAEPRRASVFLVENVEGCQTDVGDFFFA